MTRGQPIHGRPGCDESMRTYRFHSLDRPGADSLADDLRGQGLAVAVIRPGRRPVPGWVVEATGDDQNEEWLEVLARFYGGSYEREDLTGP
jgi:hypothetical protein